MTDMSLSSDFADALAIVRDELSRLEDSISEEVNLSIGLEQHISALQRQEASLLALAEKERKRCFLSEIKRQEWEEIEKRTVPIKTTTSTKEERIKESLNNLKSVEDNHDDDDDADKELNTFLNFCFQFRSTFSSDKLQKRSRDLLEEEKKFAQEMQQLSRQRTVYQQSVARCAVEQFTCAKEKSKLEAMNKDLDVKARQSQASSTQVSSLLAQEQQRLQDRLLEIHDEISAVEQEISQLRMSLSLQRVELADAVDKKKRTEIAAQSKKCERVKARPMQRSYIPRQLSPKTSPSSLQQPPEERLKSISASTHREQMAARDAMVSPATPKKTQGRQNKRHKKKSGRRVSSPDEMPTVSEMDIFGGIRH